MLRKQIFCLHCDSFDQLAEYGFWEFAECLAGVIISPGADSGYQYTHRYLLKVVLPADSLQSWLPFTMLLLDNINVMRNQDDLIERHKLESDRILRDRQELVNQFTQYKAGIIHEISERRKAEAALRNSERLYRLLAENVSDVIWIMDLRPKLKFVSSAVEKIYGWTADEFINLNISDYTAPDSLEKAFEVYGAEIAKIQSADMELNQPFILEVQQFRKDGSAFWAEIVGRLVHDDFQKEVVFFGVTRDISERKRIMSELILEKEKAEVMNRLKTNFLANMSHEIRTPLNGIMGFAEIITYEAEDEKVRDFAETIKKGGKRLLDTLNTVLDFAKLEAEKVEVVLQNIDVLPVLSEVIKLYLPAAQNKGLQIIEDYQIRQMILAVDEKYFRNAVSNVLSNALKFTIEGSIRIRAFSDNNSASASGIIEIEDTGIGIPENYLPVIFEEFRQVSEGRNRAFEGTGLGLTITRRFVEKMNGQITVRSRLNYGTTFAITFPLAVQTEEKIVRQNDQPAHASPVFPAISDSELPRILFVDDDDVSRELVVLMLRGYCVVDLAESDTDCAELLEKNNYSVILLDINLGSGKDGLELFQEIRALEKYRNTPVVALTAFALNGDKEEFLNSGFDFYLSKPFARNDIVTLIKGILESIKAEQPN